MRIRFFLRIFLGVMAANLYANGQVESMGTPDQSTSILEGDELAQSARNFQEFGKTLELGKTRDPFWPVGYTPPVHVQAAPTAAGSAEAVDETRGHVDFSGLTREEQAVIKSQMIVGGILQQGDTCLAIINQQLVKEGEELSLEAAQKTYRFGVKKLTPEKILLESMQE